MRSLDDGPSKIVPVRMPDSLRERVVAALAPGETVSGVARELLEKWVQKREKQRGKK